MTTSTTPPTGSAPARPTRGGLIALILGIVAVVFALIPFLSYVAGFIGIAAIVVGAVAIRRLASGPKGSAIAGLVLGIVALILAIVMSIVYTTLFFLGAVASSLTSSGFPTELPTDFPSSLPTDLPSPSSLSTAPPTAEGGAVVYRVKGTGKAQTISYLSADSSGAGQEQVQNVRLPWRKSLGITGDSAFSAYSLVAQNAGSGSITCSIEVNGTVVSTKTSTGRFAVVSCTATGE